MKRGYWTIFAVAAVAAGGCSAMPPEDPVQELGLPRLQASFQSKGQAGVDRLQQDETQALCTRYAGRALPVAVVRHITTVNRATLRYPADGDYFGDWRRGEMIAQSGSGRQANDDPAKPAGGNCYACHQLSLAEVAYGTLGPSLAGYGRLRGGDPAAVRSTWEKLYNSNAQVACSRMPRFGHQGILDDSQLRDLMALLLDPQSPVNR